ncbi:hypothetical protein O3P69_019488 [Scylla paramamosain]|uniref:lysoplasmalogenase n=1 Tax=Scylla paramamosain TaxID=85552 RepID=A0AAW0SX87_SCYPA
MTSQPSLPRPTNRRRASYPRDIDVGGLPFSVSCLYVIHLFAMATPKQVLKSVGPKLVPFFKTVAIYFVLFIPSDQPSLLAMVIKCLPVISLIAFVLLHGMSLGEEYAYSRRILLGLVFSLIGDALLIWEDLFVHGLAAFLVAQILYISAFGFSPFNVYVAAAVYSAMALGIATLLPGTAGGLSVGMPIYTFFLMTMELWTWTKLCSCVGGLLFAASDCIIGVNAFLFRVPHSQALIMTTYYAAQLGISLSVVDSKASYLDAHRGTPTPATPTPARHHTPPPATHTISLPKSRRRVGEAPVEGEVNVNKGGAWAMEAGLRLVMGDSHAHLPQCCTDYRCYVNVVGGVIGGACTVTPPPHTAPQPVAPHLRPSWSSPPLDGVALLSMVAVTASCATTTTTTATTTAICSSITSPGPPVTTPMAGLVPSHAVLAQYQALCVQQKDAALAGALPPVMASGGQILAAPLHPPTITTLSQAAPRGEAQTPPAPVPPLGDHGGAGGTGGTPYPHGVNGHAPEEARGAGGGEGAGGVGGGVDGCWCGGGPPAPPCRPRGPDYPPYGLPPPPCTLPQPTTSACPPQDPTTSGLTPPTQNAPPRSQNPPSCPPTPPPLPVAPSAPPVWEEGAKEEEEEEEEKEEEEQEEEEEVQEEEEEEVQEAAEERRKKQVSRATPSRPSWPSLT